MRKIYLFIVLGIVSVIKIDDPIKAQTVTTESRSIQSKCKITKHSGGKYDLLYLSRNNEDPKTLFVFVKIKSKNINRKYLLQFVKRVREQYYNEKNIIVEIFDDDENAGYHSVMEFKTKKVVADGYRGEYSLFRDKSMEELTYSEIKGNPIDEIRIKLSDGEPINNIK